MIFHDHTQAHQTLWKSSGRVISPTHRSLPDNTQHSQKTNIHAPCGIRNRNPGKRAAVSFIKTSKIHILRVKNLIVKN
jgi:hypothetical protein